MQQTSPDIKAERTCVAQGLQAPGMIPEAGLEPPDFSDPRLGAIWGAMVDLMRLDQPVEPAAVGQRAGHPMLAYELLSESPPTSENIAYFGRQVRDAAIDREIRGLADKLIRGKDRATGAELLGNLQDGLAQIRLPQQSRGRELRTGMHSTLDKIEERWKGGGGLIGVKTGLNKLDFYTCGLPRGVPIVIGARPGIGKSALCLTIARLAAWHGAVVDYYSLEDTEEIVHCRALAQASGLDLQRVRAGELHGAEWARLQQAAGELADVYDNGGGTGKILVVDDVPRSIEELSQTIASCAIRRKTDLVVVDYVQLLRAWEQRKHGGTRNDELTYCMQELTRLARRYNLALIIAAQLRRDADEAPMPGLRHIKDCGQIDQDVRCALMLSETKERDPETKELLPIRVAYLVKNNNGPSPKMFPLSWDAKSVSFGDCDNATTEQFWVLWKAKQRRRK